MVENMWGGGRVSGKALIRSFLSGLSSVGYQTRPPPSCRPPGLERIIQRNPSYDVRSLLDGVGGVLSSLVRMLAADPAYLLQAHRPLPLPAADRAAATELLTEALRVRPRVVGAGVPVCVRPLWGTAVGGMAAGRRCVAVTRRGARRAQAE